MRNNDTGRHWVGILILASAITACNRNADDSNPEVDGKEQQHDHSQHSHGDLEITSFGDTTPIAAVRVQIDADASSGWNVHLQTEHFRFAPENINKAAAASEGHAHLYVDGFKIARLYGNWYHLKKLTPGEHTVRITLNANDHSQWSHNGEPISASTHIMQY